MPDGRLQYAQVFKQELDFNFNFLSQEQLSWPNT